MAVSIGVNPAQSVVVTRDAVVLDGFEERDPEVVRVVAEADDPEAEVHRLLAIGARAVRSAQVSVDVAVVEKQFAELKNAFDVKVRDAVAQLDELTARLLSEEDGDLRKTLDVHKGALEKLLGDTFDPQSRASVLGKFEELSKAVAADNARTIRRIVDPSDEDSPIRHLKKDLVDAFEKQLRTVQETVAELATHLKIEQGKAEVFEKSAAKGGVFEEEVFEAVSQIAAPYGDDVELLGTVAGAEGKTGDIVVALNADDVRDARYVVEVKDKKLTSPAARDELVNAMRNRHARAGVLVFSSQGNAPTAVPFSYVENRAIAVLDKESHDTAALRLACMWARWVVQRQAGPGAEGIDPAQIEAQIDQAARSLRRVTQIKSAHTAAKKQIDRADDELVLLAKEMESVLDELAAQIETPES